MKSKIISLLVLGSIFIGGVQANAETIDNSSKSKAVSTASGYKYNKHYWHTNNHRLGICQRKSYFSGAPGGRLLIRHFIPLDCVRARTTAHYAQHYVPVWTRRAARIGSRQ